MTLTTLELSTLEDQLIDTICNEFEILKNPKSHCNAHSPEFTSEDYTQRMDSRRLLLEQIEFHIGLKAKLHQMWLEASKSEES